MACSEGVKALVSGIASLSLTALCILVIIILVKAKTLDDSAWKKIWISAGIIGGLFVVFICIHLFVC